MKKTITFCLIILLVFAFAGCGSKTSEQENAEPAAETTEAQVEEINNSASESGTLVVYFSCTGTTKGVAETIAEVTGGDLYEIIPEESYTSEDLDYYDDNSRTSIEQNDTSARPEISSEIDNWNAYSTVYIGYPIWWGQEPRIMDTFVERYDFTDKTVIPFCTSGSSGVGNSASNMEGLAGKGTWMEGKRFGAGASTEEISEWINELGKSI